MHNLMYAAGALQLTAHVPFIFSTIKGKTKPSTTATGIWMLLSFSLLISSLTSGAYSNLPFIAAGCIVESILFTISIKKGYRKWTALDPICLVLGAAGIAIWYLTKEASYNVYMGTLVDWIALMPVIYKSYKDPWSENTLSWRINLAAAICLVLAVDDTRLVVLVVALTQLMHSLIINTLLIKERGIIFGQLKVGLKNYF